MRHIVHIGLIECRHFNFFKIRTIGVSAAAPTIVMRGADPFVYRGANKGRAKFLPLFTACHVYRNFLTSVKISHTLPAIYYDGDDDDEEEPYIPAPTGPSEPYIPAPTGPAEPYKPAPTGLAAVADISGSLEDYVTAGSEVSTGSQDGILVSIEVDFESMTTIGKDHDANESILHNQLRQNPEFLRDLSRKMLNDSSRAKLIEDVISNGSTTPLSQQASWDIACIINRRLQFVPLQRTSNFGRTHCCFSCGYYLQGIYFNRKEASLEDGECEKCRIEEDSVPRYAPSELTMPTFQFFPLSEPSEDLPEFENASKKDLMFYNVCPNVLMRGQSKCNKCSLQKVVRESVSLRSKAQHSILTNMV